ncbi:putative Cucumisin [metagenome]|uniref:Putative Cucumisin n=1 Tax=metagenome TaxID=256318 RepID=A0A2P2C4S2_9ZZZZ
MQRSAVVGSLRRWCAVATSAAALVALTTTVAEAAPEPAATPALYLVTLDGGGTTAYAGPLAAERLLERQDRVLRRVDARPPLYRWTTALNGFAVALTSGQAQAMAAMPGVVSVERNTVHRLTAGPAAGTAARSVASGDPRAGAGVVIGVIDSGIDAANPLFASVPAVVRSPRFRGECAAAVDWPAGSCTDKIVGARWFIGGFGSANVRSSSSLSPADDNGHGTLVASVAAGNPGVSVRVGAQSFGRYAGRAPRAQLAVYKACWTAPDPSGDGCATADLVTAIDRATADHVDVLNLAVAGSSSLDTVDRALLGATEGGVFVAAAAGNDRQRAYAAHAVPWVTSVGALRGRIQGGTLRWPGGSVAGATSSQRSVTARVVDASDIAAPGFSRAASASCLPGSLDAGRAAGRIVICARGDIGRVDKSSTVALADGIGMVLANARGTDVHADFQRVPTLHVSAAAARSLKIRLRTHPVTVATLRPGGTVGGPSGVARWSASGDPRGDLVKPDLIAPGVDVLGALPPAAGAHWTLFSGTSVATAQVSGEAAALLAKRPGWQPARVRSALMTTTRTTLDDASSLDQGAGRLRAEVAQRPGLVYDLDPRDYRRYLSGRLEGRDLNLPSIKAVGPVVVRRTVTNVGKRPMYYSVRARGFTTHQVSVAPVALRLAPGQSRTFTVTIAGADDRLVDSGWITWRGANGTSVRIPVVISD